MTNIIEFFKRHGWLDKIDEFTFSIVNDSVHLSVKANTPLFSGGTITNLNLNVPTGTSVLDNIEAALFDEDVPMVTTNSKPLSPSPPTSKLDPGGAPPTKSSGKMPPMPPSMQMPPKTPATGKKPTEVKQPPVPKSPPPKQKNNSEENIGDGAPGKIEEVQKIAIHGVLKFSQLSWEELAKGAFEQAGLPVDTIPDLNDLSYEEALEVIKYGNTLKRAKK